jgi:molybdenum cofactor cytidylyltransferase
MTTETGSLGAVVLAAGDSRRMGRPKALLKAGGETFIERWLRVLAAAGVTETRVVLGREHARIRAEVSLPERLVAINSRPEDGMLSSFLVGLDRLPAGLRGVFLCPVDHPAVDEGVLCALADACRPDGVVLPVWEGRRGHPALFGAELFAELRQAPASVGARAVVRSDPGRVIEVDAGKGILVDVDTPEEYRRFRED